VIGGLPAGELAALSTGFIWACTSILFTTAGRSVSPVATNLFKTSAATVLFALVLLVRDGVLFDASLGLHRVTMLGLSGVFGFALGDSLLFTAYQYIGTRRALLVMGLNPLLGAWWAWVLLGEHLRPADAVGMALALGGTGLVIHTGMRALPREGHGRMWKGVAMGLGAAVGQASGALAAKAVLEGVDTFAATEIRVAAGALSLVIFALVRGVFLEWARGLVVQHVLWRVALASVSGPFVGVWMMIYGLQNAPTGVVLTLLSLSPVWLLPLGSIFQKDVPSPRECLGAVVAVGGVALLLLG